LERSFKPSYLKEERANL